MRKVLTLNCESLFDEYIYTDYDESGNGHNIVIDYKDKKAFLRDLVDEFKRRANNLLDEEYQCECCENIRSERENFLKCSKCGEEICDLCATLEDDWVCDDCRLHRDLRKKLFGD
jgi:hypothetical protein